MPPAVLKGYVDRVFRPGVAYEFVEGDCGEGVPVGLLRARVGIVLNTSNTAMQREVDVFGDPLETLWRNCIFGLCGVSDVRRRVFQTVCTSTLGQREDWLEEVEQIVVQTLGE
jgi:putative NADPH-quinone reductase